MRKGSIVLVLIVVLAAAGARGAVASGWSIQRTPNPAGAKDVVLYGVSCTSGSACIAVGVYNKGMLAERWNGTKWSIQHTPNPAGATAAGLGSVSCTSGSACTAVGSYFNGTTTVTLVERWNGAKWSIQHAPNPAHGKHIFLNSVYCTSGSACTAVGFYNKGMLAERWNGTKWSIQHTPEPAGARDSGLNAVACSSGSACTAVGGDHEGMLAERWNGTKWSIEHVPSPAHATESYLDGVACTAKRACTAVGAYDIGYTSMTLAERWNGTKWSVQRTPNPTSPAQGELNGVACTSKRACTAVGNYTIGETSMTLAERWNGTRWSIQTTPNPTGKHSVLDAVACSSKRACTAVGSYYNGNTTVTLAERWNGG